MKAELGRSLSGMIVLIVLSSCCTAGTGGRKERQSRVPEVGQPMPRGSSIAGLVHGGRKYCAHRVDVENVTYSFDVNCGESIVRYVQTRDRDFRTPEGVAIGQPLRDAVTTEGVSGAPLTSRRSR